MKKKKEGRNRKKEKNNNKHISAGSKTKVGCGEISKNKQKTGWEKKRTK
jgi:hypothetical protein